MDAWFIQDLLWHPPTTKLYRLDDGSHLAVLVVDAGAVIMGVPMSLSHIHSEVSVFHSDENGVLIDADGDPLNGLTPFASSDPETGAAVRLDAEVSTHADALAALGYTLIDTPPNLDTEEELP